MLFFLVNLAVLEYPSIHYTIQHYMLIDTYIGFAFTNIMACGAFRQVALCKMEDGPEMTSTRIAAALDLVPVQFAQPPTVEVP